MNKQRLLSIVAAPVVLVALFFFFRPDPHEKRKDDAFQRVTNSQSVDQETGSGLSFSNSSAAVLEKDAENQIFYRLASTITVGYGNEAGQFGFISEEEQETAGPESFAVDGRGNFVVCDTLNQRIHVLDSDGSQVEFDLSSDIAPGDVAVFQSESIIVYDYTGRLHQFDFNGDSLSTIGFDRDRWYARLEMQIVGDRVFVQSSDQTNHLVGVLEEGILRMPSEEELQESDGLVGAHGASGRRYVAHLERWARGWVDVWEPDGESVRSFPLDVPGIVSVRFLGEDSARNAFVQVERVENGQVALEVHQFDPAGETIAKVDIPENDYLFWTAKLLSVDADGNIYQALPQPEGMKLNVFQLFNPG